MTGYKILQLFCRYQRLNKANFALKSILVKKISVHIFLAFLLILSCHTGSYGQVITPTDKRKLQAKQDTLARFAMGLVIDSTTAGRMRADSNFTRTLVRAMQIKNSFLFPFDSVKGIAKIYAPDSTFRIITWTIEFAELYPPRQRGVIQLRTRDGSPKLIPLRDYSELTANADDSVRTKNNWIGAMYYNIVKTEYQGRNYYTLFGYDSYSQQSSKKWIEVMYFNQNMEPVFGGPFFTYANDNPPQKPKNRISLEFKKDARTLVNYIDDLGVILVDHLVSETDQPDLKWTYVPDGDNEAYKWENGKWVHLDKAFDYKVDMSGADPYMGRPPIEVPILDNKGNRNEKKLMEKSEQNRKKENPVTPPVKDNP
jgi:hypothetical protein